MNSKKHVCENNIYKPIYPLEPNVVYQCKVCGVWFSVEEYNNIIEIKEKENENKYGTNESNNVKNGDKIG